MPSTAQFGLANTPAAVGQSTIETTVNLTGTQQQGTQSLAFIKNNGSSPQWHQVVVSNGANQTVTIPAGVVDVMLVPPDGSTSGNVVLTNLSVAFPPLFNTIIPINPLAYTDICFDQNQTLPTSVVLNANAANLPINLYGW